jgi:hypothetical protein
LELLSAAEESVSEDFFDFEFFCPFYQVRWWSGEVCAVFGGLVVGGQKGCMEDIVNAPGWREIQLICHRGHFFGDCKRAVSPRG